MEKIIHISHLTKKFNINGEPLVIFDNADLEIFKGEKVAIVGSSGSGKSTLLSMLAGLDMPTSGEIIVAQEKLHMMTENELAEYRNKKISIIFQSFELISPFTVIENICSPLEIRGDDTTQNIRQKAERIMEEVDLGDRKNAFPSTLSGGEKQRVAIARALIQDTDIILADEPTGSLDQKTGSIVFDLLLREVHVRRKTLVMITHDMNLAQKMDRVILVKDKLLYEQ